MPPKTYTHRVNLLYCNVFSKPNQNNIPVLFSFPIFKS